MKVKIHILNDGGTEKCVITFMFRPLHSGERSIRFHYTGA
jgi:hypothetical protein